MRKCWKQYLLLFPQHFQIILSLRFLKTNCVVKAYSLPNDKFSDFFKMETFTDQKLYAAQMKEFVLNPFKNNYYILFQNDRVCR